MKKYHILIGGVIVLFLFGFSTSKSDPFKKLRAFTELIRLVEENYVDEIDINKRYKLSTIPIITKYSSNEMDMCGISCIIIWRYFYVNFFILI